MWTAATELGMHPTVHVPSTRSTVNQHSAPLSSYALGVRCVVYTDSQHLYQIYLEEYS